MLKHIPRIVLIPPPNIEDKDEIWELFSILMASDIELIHEITNENKKLAYLNSQQVRFFKQLMTALNESICTYNIDSIFKIFEVISMLFN